MISEMQKTSRGARRLHFVNTAISQMTNHAFFWEILNKIYMVYGWGSQLFTSSQTTRGWEWPQGTRLLFHLICFIILYKNIWFQCGDFDIFQFFEKKGWILTVYKFSKQDGVGWHWGTLLLFYFIRFIWTNNCPIKEYIWFRGMDINRLLVFKKKGGCVTLVDFFFIAFDLFYCPIQKYIWFMGGDLNCLQVLKQGGGGDPRGLAFYFIWFVLLYRMGWGSWLFLSSQTWGVGLFDPMDST